MQANIISTIDWSLNVWGVNPFPGGLSPLVIPAVRFGGQVQALLPVLQAPFGSVTQPTIGIEEESWHGPNDAINPGAIKARAWRSNVTTGRLCVLVAMVNVMDCSTVPMPPRPNCPAEDKDYPGFVSFHATLGGLPESALTASPMAFTRIHVFDAAGMPQPNQTKSMSAAGQFSDQVGAGEVNLYLLDVGGAC
eukprot:SAG22_NODE_2359_length_2666_cov_1.614725_2_plen_193_part_00